LFVSFCALNFFCNIVLLVSWYGMRNSM